MAKPIWGPRRGRQDRKVLDILFRGVSFASLLLSRGLKRDPSPFDVQSLHFPQDFDTVGSETQGLQKKNLKKEKRGLWRTPSGD